MTRIRVTKDKIDDIADAIRAGISSQSSMTLAEMPTNIAAIPEFDASSITARNTDIVSGKTFYSVDRALETGTNSLVAFTYIDVVLPSSLQSSPATTYGKGLFILLPNNPEYGVAGPYMISSDGINWATKNTLPAPTAWYDGVYYADGTFYVIASSKLFYSTDGINWSERTLPKNNLQFFAYGKGLFVILPYSGNVGVYSTDGINWSETTLPIYCINLNSIAYGNGRFVAIKKDGTTIYSDDGINWTAGNLPSQSGDWKSINYGKNIFICSNSYGYIAYSSDGINWTKISLSGFISRVVYCNGKFFTFPSNSTRINYSIDGIHWSTYTASSNMKTGSVVTGNGMVIGFEFGSSSSPTTHSWYVK